MQLRSDGMVINLRLCGYFASWYILKDYNAVCIAEQGIKAYVSIKIHNCEEQPKECDRGTGYFDRVLTAEEINEIMLRGLNCEEESDDGNN